MRDDATATPFAPAGHGHSREVLPSMVATRAAAEPTSTFGWRNYVGGREAIVGTHRSSLGRTATRRARETSKGAA